jgi:hypothetical protein
MRESRIAALHARSEKILAQIAEVERRNKAEARKRDTRLKVVVGAALLADAAIHDDTKMAIRSVLQRATKAPRDREFLKDTGWL